jgi:uncharacterized membrane protein
LWLKQKPLYMLEWYKKVFENYSNFNGRARRSEYWYFTLMQFLIYCALCILALITPFILIVAGLYALASIIPSLAVAVRRMHDQDPGFPDPADRRYLVPDIVVYRRHQGRQPVWS